MASSAILTRVSLEETGVPLVILSPAAPAGRVVDSPVSLRDLPATVVDLLGLSAASPFPGRSLAAYWKLAPGEAAARRHQPCLLRAGGRDRVPNSAGHGRRHSGFQMSLVALGHHYVRDGMGDEQLYDLKTDPYEQLNLMESNSGKRRGGRLPKDAPRRADRQPRLVRGGKGLPGKLPEMARRPR